MQNKTSLSNNEIIFVSIKENRSKIENKPQPRQGSKMIKDPCILEVTASPEDKQIKPASRTKSSEISQVAPNIF